VNLVYTDFQNCILEKLKPITVFGLVLTENGKIFMINSNYTAQSG